MSRYPPRIIINNPEKNVPDDIIQQFYTTLQTGDIDKIRDFSIKYKNKFNLIDSFRRGKPDEMTNTKNTPFHVVLELDNQIANDSAKLMLMKYLSSMGAPMDLPNAKNIWPIHLAAQLQNEDIVDFLVNKKVSISPRDSSNNVPLHYAVNGTEVPCDIKANIGSIVPQEKVPGASVNQVLNMTNQQLMKLLSENPLFRDELIQIINQIENIPHIYRGSELEKDLDKAIINIFTDITLDPNYTGGLDKQQVELEQLINSTYNRISNEVMQGVTNPLEIGPGNGGWGPELPIDSTKPRTDPGNSREPNELERILKADQFTSDTRLEGDLNLRKQQIFNLNTAPTTILLSKKQPGEPSTLGLVTLADVTKRVSNELTKLDFDDDYGLDVTAQKAWYLLAINYFKINHKKDLINEIINDMQLISKKEANKLISNSKSGYQTDPDVLWLQLITNIIDKYLTTPTELDEKFSAAIKAIDPGTLSTELNQCFSIQLFPWFNDDLQGVTPEYVDRSILGKPIPEILKDPIFESLRNDYRRFRPQYGNENSSWFNALNNIVGEMRPDPTSTSRNIFRSGNRYSLPKDQRYTFFDVFRLVNAVSQTIKLGEYTWNAVPYIFEPKMGEWIGAITDHYNAKERWDNREFIFLEKMFYLFAINDLRTKLGRCYDRILEVITKSPQVPGTPINDFTIAITPFDDRYLVGMVVPSNPDPANLINVVPNKIWDDSNELVSWFNTQFESENPQIKSNLKDFFNNQLVGLATNVLSLENINDLRSRIEVYNSVNEKSFNKIATVNVPQSTIILDDEFKTKVRDYLINLSSNDYGNLINKIKFIDDYDNHLGQLRTTNPTFNTKEITQMFFLVETYGYFYATTYKKLSELTNRVNQLNNIVTDIIQYINLNMYYYIPQIFLPALIKETILAITDLIEINNFANNFDLRYAQFIQNIQTDSPEKANIVRQGMIFQDYIRARVNNLYQRLSEMTEYHNEVIDFLNTNSAYNLIRQTGGQSLLFSGNLSKIDDFPPTLQSASNLQNFNKILANYRIPEITYYAGNLPPQTQTLTDTQAEIFKSSDYATTHNFDTYRGIIPTLRKSTLNSNSLNTGDNSQLNLEFEPTTNLINIKEIKTKLAGSWLTDDINDATSTDGISFSNGFIAYIQGQYDQSAQPTQPAPTAPTTTTLTAPVQPGQPTAISPLLNRHLTDLKEQIVKNVIQYVVDNQLTDTKDLYQNLKIAGTAPTYTELSDVKVYSVIGRLTDAIINKLIEAATKQTIAGWIHSGVQPDFKYKSLVSNVINIIRDSTYSKASFGEVNKKNIDDLLAGNANPKLINYKLTQIEPDPTKLEYTKNPDRMFIRYLYKLDYFSPTNSNSTKKCYRVNPRIATKLINSETINARNSDGVTPLYMATELHNPKLVKKLVKHGAKVDSFKNNYGFSPLTMIIRDLHQHVDFMNGNPISKAIEAFAVPFNNMLAGKLLDEKFGNNVIKDITMGVPIQIIMYNHMFHVYLYNYRFDLTPELKDELNKLAKKYIPGIDRNKQNPYPIDLFDLSEDAVIQIIKPYKISNVAKADLNRINRKKVSIVNERIKFIENQINGLTKEKQNTTDSQQVAFLDNILSRLSQELTDLNKEKSDLQYPDPNGNVDVGMLAYFQSEMDNITNRVGDRSISLVQFYDESFGRVGKNKEVYLGIWKNYLQKNINQTPSMIFLVINVILNRILYTLDQYPDLSRMPATLLMEIKSELKTIATFMKKYRDYVEFGISIEIGSSSTSDLEQSQQVIYLINLIITPAVKNLIANQIYQGISEMIGAGTIAADENALFDQIMATKFNGQTIDSYLENVLPNLAYRYYSANLTDIGTSTGTDLFQPIINIIRDNQIVRIDESSVLIQNFRNYVVPYLLNTYQSFINTLTTTIYGYERYLLNTYQLVKILDTLINAKSM